MTAGLLIVAAAAAPVAASAAAPVQSQGGGSVGLASAQISLGFSPATLTPVGQGVPVYTVGQTIWAESAYSGIIVVELSSPSPPGAGFAVALGVSPGVIIPIHTFGQNDTDGVWNLTIANPPGPVVIPIHFVNPASHPISLGKFAYALQGGNLSISTQANLGDSYDQEVCAAGVGSSAGVTLQLPAGMHDQGALTIIPGNPVGVSTAGEVNNSFSFWFELYHPYALDVSTTNSLVVNDLMTASTEPVAVASAGTVAAPLSLNLPLDPGRYEMRAFFENSTSLDSTQVSLLVVNNSTWVSLSGACPSQPIKSSDLSYSESLAPGPAAWPRSLYVMYRTFGVEAVAAYPVRANVSSVSFVAVPWNQTLQDAKVSVVPPAQGVVQTSQAGGSLYVLASQYPVSLNYSLGIHGGQNIAAGTITLQHGYTNQTRQVRLAMLTVHVLDDPTAGTTLQVRGPQGVSITSGVGAGANQTSSLLLPSGSYTVTASQSGSSQTAQVQLQDGVAASVTLNFSTFLTLEIILVVTAAMAAIANVLIWVLRSKGLASRLSGARETRRA